MKLSEIQLEAFFEVSKTRNFHKAAKNLHVSQPAVTHRIKNLEDTLGVSLFSRGIRSIKLTQEGEVLLRYCQTKIQIETEAIQQMSSPLFSREELRGHVRVGAFNSVGKKVVLPAISNLLKDQPGVRFTLEVAELRRLPVFLKTGKVDFIVTDYKAVHSHMCSRFLGYEEYVQIEPTRRTKRGHLYIDHELEDRMTEIFFAQNQQLGSSQSSQNSSEFDSFSRSFINDNYAIIEAVRLGMGKAVVPAHLCEGVPGIKVSSKSFRYKHPIYLQFFAQPVYSKLHQQVEAVLLDAFQKEPFKGKRD